MKLELHIFSPLTFFPRGGFFMCWRFFSLGYVFKKLTLNKLRKGLNILCYTNFCHSYCQHLPALSLLPIIKMGFHY